MNDRLNIHEILNQAPQQDTSFLQDYPLAGHGEKSNVDDPFALSRIADHIQEVVKNGRVHRVAIFQSTVRMQIIKRGKCWWEAYIPGVQHSKAHIEISAVTDSFRAWHFYDIDGRFEVDCTYTNFRKIRVFPSSVTHIVKLQPC